MVTLLASANTRADFIFTGRASHAAASPHLGRSALDAVELMNVGVNYMREHMPSDARVHYALPIPAHCLIGAGPACLRGAIRSAPKTARHERRNRSGACTRSRKARR